jgi:hypothetical protein
MSSYRSSVILWALSSGFFYAPQEDLAVDRLNSFAYWGSTVDGLNVLLLMMQDDFNNPKFRRKLKGSELEPLVTRFSNLVRQVDSGRRTLDQIAVRLLDITDKWKSKK